MEDRRNFEITGYSRRLEGRREWRTSKLVQQDSSRGGRPTAGVCPERGGCRRLSVIQAACSVRFPGIPCGDRPDLSRLWRGGAGHCGIRRCSHSAADMDNQSGQPAEGRVWTFAYQDVRLADRECGTRKDVHFFDLGLTGKSVESQFIPHYNPPADTVTSPPVLRRFREWPVAPPS